MTFQHQSTPFSEIEPSGRLALLFSYWQRLKPGGLPNRRDINLADMSPTFLPHVFLVDVLDEGQRFRWRMIGAHIVRHAGTDDTGLDLDISVSPNMRATIIGHYQIVARERRPLGHRGEFVGRDGRLYRYDRLLLPVLADDGASIDTILGGAAFAVS